MSYRASVGSQGYRFADLREVLADLPLRCFLDVALIPYEIDEVTRLIVDSQDAAAGEGFE